MEYSDVWSTLAALTLICLAALHALWATGSPWPARSTAELSRRVIGRFPAQQMPRAPACLAVAALLLLASGIVLTAPGTPDHSPVHTGAQVVAGTLLLRGVGGYALPALTPMRGTPFVRLNALLYSPLCLLLAAAVHLSLR